MASVSTTVVLATSPRAAEIAGTFRTPWESAGG
jgi:hypothetical protein